MISAFSDAAPRPVADHRPEKCRTGARNPAIRADRRSSTRRLRSKNEQAALDEQHRAFDQ
jgi:hypothetical protein